MSNYFSRSVFDIGAGYETQHEYVFIASKKSTGSAIKLANSGSTKGYIFDENIFLTGSQEHILNKWFSSTNDSNNFCEKETNNSSDDVTSHPDYPIEYLKTGIIMLLNDDRELIYRFIVAELDAASSGNDVARSFVANSGISSDEYDGAFRKEKDPAIDNVQWMLIDLSGKHGGDPSLVLHLRLSILDSLMMHAQLGHYSLQRNIS